MMHLSLKFGFTRQYPLAFSLYSVILVKKGLVKEAMRMGQVAEKIARLDDFYGGEAVAMFHWHVGHWRRTYKRSLEPVLKIYNAQIDAGDFHHVDFSISVYSQYHLASGYDLERLSDNLQLFDSVYQDYSLPTYWHIVLPQQVVSNLLGQTANPLMFFGDAIEQEETQIKAWEDAGEKDALEYFYFLRLFVAFFFHDVDVAVTCLERITKAPEGVWIPWLVFLECYYMIQRLPATKGKVKKELKERIDEEKGKLIDWYNGGAPNPNAMVSLLEAELVIALKSGKQLSAMKVQEYYNEAVDAAHDDGAAHLEAFALERVGLHFHATGVDGLSAEYLEKAHTAYDRWGCVAKVIDIETEFAAKLEITTRRQRPCAAFIERNKGLKPDQNRQIGGGHGEIKAPNLKKAGKNIGKRFKKGGKTVKGLFSKKEQADVQEDDVQLSPNKPRSSLAVEEADSNVSDEETNDVEASPKRTSYFSPQSKKKKIGISFRKGKPKKEKMPLLEGD